MEFNYTNNVTDKYTYILNINLGSFLSEIKPQADGANTLWYNLGAFLSEIKPQADGANTLWYNLGAFLSEIKPQADGANGFRYNLTPDIIGTIFFIEH